MNLRKFDMFSQSFQFNIGGQQIRKGTCLGALLTIAILSATLVYFIYLSNQYFTNQIDPKFRTQSFITEDTTEITLRDELVGFRFEYDANISIDTLQKQQNLTYLVHYAYFLYQNHSDVIEIPLNITECTNQELIGFNCLDFSSLQNYTLEQNTKYNILSQILIYTYGCYDIDSVKTSIPDNCANQTDIDNMINGIWAQYRLKLLTQQYNTTSQEVQVNYRNAYFVLLSNQFTFTTAKAQQQITNIKKGFFIQQDDSFTSPVQYQFQSQGFDRNFSLTEAGVGPYFQLNLVMDEIVQQFQIQYPTFPEILSIVNGTFALLMTLGIVGRFFAKKYIQEDIYLLFLQNMYHDTYEQLIQSNKIFEQKERVCLDSQSQQYYENIQEHQDTLGLQKFIVPNFITKLKQLVDISALPKENSNQRLKERLETENQENNYQCQNQLNKIDSIVEQMVQDSQQQQNTLNLVSLPTTHDIIPQLLKPSFTVDQKQQNLIKSQFSVANQLQENKKKNFINQLQQKLKKIVPKSSQSTEKSNKKDICNISKDIITKKRVLSITVRKSQSGQSPTLINPQQKKNQNQDAKVINEHFSQKFKLFQDSKISEKIKNAIFRMKFCKRKQCLDQSVKNLIDSQVNKSLDILELYKEIIFIKKAIMILLTKDQLAAIQLVGCSPYFLSQELLEIEKKKYSEQNEEKKNYFEQQLAISLSEQLQQKYIKKFLSKCQSNYSVSEIDYRILSSILKSRSK